ncbi:MAG: 50S ribosomal protein L30 [bacterium]|nr:50S ribosomal protein L30 [bacterium]
MAKQIKLTLIKSIIGTTPKQRKIVQSLGLRNMHQEVVHQDSLIIRGMVNKIPHMLKVLEI